MKIISLQSENIKRLKAVEIVPKDNTVIISGKNGQGKSSILDSIYYALGGKDKIPSKPIRDGEKKAEITLDLGDYTVKRTFTDKGSYLEVMSKEGAKFPSPQAMIDKIVGKLSFDPLEFSNKSSKEQRQILIDLVGLNFVDEDKEKDRLYQERLIVGREGQNLPKFTEEVIKEAEAESKNYEINISKVLEELNNAESNNDRIVRLTNELGSEADIIDKLEADLKIHKANFDKLKAEVDNSKLIPTEKLKETLTTAEQTNKRITDAKRILEDNNKVIAKRKEYEDLTKQIEIIDDTKKQLLEACPMPINGLSINDDGVVYNGIPFDQISSAEQLKVSLSIAMAMNSTLKVIRIMDGSLLDDDNLKLISEMANDKDYQIWIECVRNEKNVGFYIEDGMVK